MTEGYLTPCSSVIEVDEVFSGLDADPQLYERMRSTMPGLPGDPGEQPRPTTTPDCQWPAQSLRAHG